MILYSRFIFKYKGLKIVVIGPSSQMAKLLLTKEYLSHFLCDKNFVASNSETFILKIRSSKLRPGAYRFWVPISSYKISGLKKRWVSYRDGTQVNYLFEKKSTSTAKIYCSSMLNFEEELVNLILSWMGEKLERLGFLRVHAAALATETGAIVVGGRSGVGKSTFSMQAIQQKNKILSDEMILFKDGWVHHFPVALRMLDPKKNSSAEKINIPLELDNLPPAMRLKKFFYLLSKPLKFRRLNFIFDIILGLGLTQMFQYFFRIDSLAFLFELAVRRLFFCIRLFFQKKIQIEIRSDSAAKTYEQIMRLS